MKLTMRWYGTQDSVTLPHIRQVPAVTGIMSALYDVPVGDVWPLDKLRVLNAHVEQVGLSLDVIESIPL